MTPFDEIVHEHGPAVWRVCAAIVGPLDADDAWSESFLAALRAYPALPTGSNVRGWLVTIAHNKSIDLVRKSRRTPRATDDLIEIGVDDTVTWPMDAALRSALVALAPKQRGAVVLRYIADLSYGEVAALLGGTEAAARRSTSDGIAALRHTYRRDTPQ